MKGLKSFSSWRTFVTGMLIGYIFAWGIHWAAQFATLDGHWIDEVVPYLTPQFGRRHK